MVDAPNPKVKVGVLSGKKNWGGGGKTIFQVDGIKIFGGWDGNNFLRVTWQKLFLTPPISSLKLSISIFMPLNHKACNFHKFFVTFSKPEVVFRKRFKTGSTKKEVIFKIGSCFRKLRDLNRK